ncbi:MAG: ATP synthase F0 subunit B [Bradymonadales bacterium]|nr:ATP synthase F0 subunit B [Bradymonadales bacterium]
MTVHRNPIARLWLVLAALLAVVLGGARLALAAGSHGSEPAGVTPVPINDVIEAIVNFLLFVGLLYWFGRRPVKRYFEVRSRRISTDLEQAAQLRQEAEEKLAEYTGRLERIDQDRQEILERYRQEASAETGLILQQARREAERIREETRTLLEYETQLARREVERRIVDQAVQMATVTIQRQLDGKAANRLIEELADSLEELPGGSAGQNL